jgi:molecular chaperone Hsp33
MTEKAIATPGPGDRSLRFLFDAADIRGETVHLEQSLADILDIHQYAPGVNRLLGEFLAAAVLLSTTLKFEGRLILQARSEGQVPLLMAECSSDLKIRAIARGAEQATSSNFDQLLRNGHLAITIDPIEGKRYQGIVPLVNGSLSSSLEAYFEQSEQLHTRLWLACDGQRAGGLLLQQLPPQVTADPVARERQWQHVYTLGATLSEGELLAEKAETLIYRLYHQEPLRLFTPARVMFDCSCSRDRTLNALSSLGGDELEEILQEQGSITMDCEFCNQQYIYQRSDLLHLLDRGSAGTLH